MHACLGYALFLAIHITWWRGRHPRRDALALFGIYSACLILLFLAISFFEYSLFDNLAATLLFTSWTFAYILVYPASQAASPSFRILYLIGRAGPGGVAEGQIFSSLGESDLFDARLHDLLGSGLVVKEKEMLSPTAKGRMLIVPFLWLRRALGLPAGKG